MSNTPKILVITASTRAGRVADLVTPWFLGVARSRDDVVVDEADLRDFQLPYYDKPVPAAMLKPEDQPTEWATKVDGADGFVIVTPEYNYGYPAVLKSALDALY